ncbi:MAG: hypothetical protein EXS05_00820 [Planctomycetaceae bacterium]|nr:hypothetical protein [Planctomycetaceae bacterium]
MGIVSRISLILCFASLGMLLCSAVVEFSGGRMPVEDWLSGFAAYAILFFVAYRLTRPLPVNPPGRFPDGKSESN